MPAHLGVATTFGLTAPAGGYVQESSREESVELATIRNETGVTVKAVPKPLVTRTVNLKGKGDANLAAVASGSFAEGVLRVTEAKQSETNEDFPDFEITGTAYLNLPEP
jgi:hypothetical protein